MRTLMMILVAVVTALITARAAPSHNPSDAFPLTALDGRPVSSASLARTGKWIMIYIPAACGGCDALLRLIRKEAQPMLPQRVAIIVANTSVEQVRHASTLFPDLAEAAWYADPSGASRQPLQVGLAPAVFGMNGGSIDWTLTGVLGSSSDVGAAMSAWVAQ